MTMTIEFRTTAEVAKMCRERREQIMRLLCDLEPEDVDTIGYVLGGLQSGRREEVEEILKLPVNEWRTAFAVLQDKIISEIRADFMRARQEV